MRALTVFLTAVVLGAIPALAQPALEIGITEYDFGQVIAGATIHHDVWFKSVGTDTVVMTDIKTGCNCAVLSLDRMALPPGDSAMATFTWETERKHRLQRKFLRIFTNASRDPYRIVFKAMTMQQGDSARPVTILPYRFAFTQVAGISRDSIEFSMKNQTDNNYAIHVITPESKNWTVYVPDSLRAKDRISGYVKRTGTGDSQFEDMVTFQFDASGIDPHRYTVPIIRKQYGK
jgi:hypothetical protein